MTTNLGKMQWEALNQVVVILEKNDGRDKLLKMVQYYCKLMLVLNPSSLVQVLAKQFSATRRILRLGRCLKLPQHLLEASELRHPIEKQATLAAALVGACSEVGDDLCWMADMRLLPQWISTYEAWCDRLWFVEMCFELPLHTYQLYQAMKKVRDPALQQDKIKYHNARVELFKLQLNQVKRVADFFHAARLAWNFPTNSKAQDAICGLISSSVAVIKHAQPKALQKLPTT